MIKIRFVSTETPSDLSLSTRRLDRYLLILDDPCNVPLYFEQIKVRNLKTRATWPRRFKDYEVTIRTNFLLFRLKDCMVSAETILRFRDVVEEQV